MLASRSIIMTLVHRSRRTILLVAWVSILAPAVATEWESLPIAPSRPLFARQDWLLEATPSTSSAIYRSDRAPEIILDNGLIRRTIRLSPNAATVGLDDLRTGGSLLRAVRPEALVTIDGKEWPVGGLVGQSNLAYLPQSEIDHLRDDPSSFAFERWETTPVEKPFDWKRTRPSSGAPWPPRGVAMVMHFVGRSEEVRGIRISIRYEIYDGIPAIGKSLTITNTGDRPHSIDSLAVEVLAAVEGESAVDTREPGQWRRPPIDVISDYMFHGMDTDTANRVARWEPDPAYTTQVSYELRTPCLLVCRPPIGPGRRLAPGESLNSFRVILILHDTSEQERRGLTLRRTWRTVAPWISENPIMMHVRQSNRLNFRAAVDQCAEVGFEMIIYTFGSGLNMEQDSPGYIQKIKEDVAYAHDKGVQVGGYSLFSSRRIDDANDVIHPDTGRTGGAIFGNAPCLGSSWGREYERKLKSFIEQTGLDLLEHDGPYPGDLCASTSHPGHRGLADSQWNQWETSRELYAWCRARGIYVNQPDCYFLCGGSKTGMGYRESNWSLPRTQQLIHARQNIFDGTWNKTVTMGWMFVPLSEYHGGGAAATLEPLKEHLDDYERHLVSSLGAGVQACYRGPRLYDSDETKALVARWVDWYKEYRDILESDIVHFRRADGRDIDGWIHVNPAIPRRAMAVLYNPLNEKINRTIKLPLYYTGLTDRVRIRRERSEASEYPLDRQSQAWLDVEIPPMGMTWLVIEKGD